MSERKKDFFKRLLLMAGIAVLAFMLLGADYPEHDARPDHTGEIAAGICEEIFRSSNNSYSSAAAENPLWFLQCVTP